MVGIIDHFDLIAQISYDAIMKHNISNEKAILLTIQHIKDVKKAIMEDCENENKK